MMPDFSPSPLQVLILWKMVFLKEEPSFSKIKKPVRQPLIDAGLVSVYKKGRTSFLRLEDKAWDWAVHNLDAKVSNRSPQSGPVLQEVLTLLKKYMQHNHISLHEFMKTGPAEATDAAPSTRQPPSAQHGTLKFDAIASQVRNAYFQHTNGSPHVRMRLATLREYLSGISRAELDDALREMKRRNQILLFPFEDPQEKREADDQAALYDASRLNHVIIFED